MNNIDVKGRWSLFQYDLYEILDGKTIDEVIGWLSTIKIVCNLEEKHENVICKINIRDDSFGGLLTDLELYGDICYKTEDYRMIPQEVTTKRQDLVPVGTVLEMWGKEINPKDYPDWEIVNEDHKDYKAFSSQAPVGMDSEGRKYVPYYIKKIK